MNVVFVVYWTHIYTSAAKHNIEINGRHEGQSFSDWQFISLGARRSRPLMFTASGPKIYAFLDALP